MKTILRSTILFFLCIHSSFVFSQKLRSFDPKKKLSQFHIDQWGKDQGLPASSLLAIIHAKDGYIWIGSYDGLLRFDGATFDHFTKSNTPAFKTNTVSRFLETADSTLWLGTQGSGLVSYKNGKFSNHGMEEAYVECMYIGKDPNIIYIGTRGNGVYQYHVKQNKIEKFQANTLGGFAIQDIVEKDGKLLIASKNGIYSFENGKLNKLKIDQKITPKKFYLDSQNTLWVGSYDGLFFYKDGELIRKIPALKDQRIYDIKHDELGNLWIAARNKVYRYNVQTSQLEELKTDRDESFEDVQSICFDQENSLWLPTRKQGLCRLKSGKFDNFGTNEGLRSSSINSLCAYGDTLVLVGTTSGHIDVLDYNHNSSSPFPLKTNLDGYEIFNIRHNKDKEIWISTYRGLLSIQPNGVERLYTDKDGLPNKKVRMSFEDKKGRFWLGTRGSGLIRFYKDGNRFEEIGKDTGFDSDFIMSISQDNQGRIVVGTNNKGLFVEQDNGKFVQYNANNGLSSNLVFNVYCDQKNVLWVATNAGICRIKNGKINIIDSRNGLPSESVFDILKSPLGYYWMPFNGGVIKVKQEDLNKAIDDNQKIKWYVFDKSDGMKNDQCKGATKSLCNAQGILFFPTSGGVLSINPRKILKNQYTPPVYINRVTIGKEVFESPISVTIRPNQKRIVIDFTALSFSAPNKVKFKYKLKGFDQEWIEITNAKRQAIYTNLSAGDYTFNVVAANNDGVWNKVGSILEIHVQPKFYNTWWFRILALLSLIALVWLIIYIRTRATQLLAKRLENTVNERTAELQQSNDEIIAQKAIVDKQNKSIIDSINYAKRIQTAMMPSQDRVNEVIPNSFIFFQPKDIVSGDFYWVEEHQGKKVAAAVDCTGHGVPGAFMSMIGNDLLNKIVIDQNILEPNIILDRLNEELNFILRQNSDTKIRDGMDIALWVYDPEQNILKFAGGHNPLVYVKDGKLTYIKGDKHAIGGFNEGDFFFQQHVIKVEKGMTFYIYSDGYQDQFGGEKNRKFMKKRLKELLTYISERAMSTQMEILKQRLNEWKGDYNQVDDILIIGAKFDNNNLKS